MPRIRHVLLALGLSACLTLLLFYPDRFEESVDRPRATEAYVTFLSDVETEPWYLTSARLLLFQLQHDPLTCDPTRDFVVLTTPRVPLSVEAQLRAEGAVVVRKHLIEGMPDQYNPEAPSNWRDQYSKLHVFNLTQYERIVYIDNDMVLTRSLRPLWDEPEAHPETGLAAAGWNAGDHDHPPRTDDHFDFNAGFFVTYPSEELFKTLLKVDGYHPGNREQALLVEYFHPDKTRPWVQLKPGWVVQFPTPEDLDVGVRILHDKFWKSSGIDRTVSEFWRQKLGRMEGYWLANASE